MTYFSEEELPRLLLDGLEEAIVLLDENLKIRAFNKRANNLTLFQFERKLVMGENILNIVQPDKITGLSRVFESVLKGEEVFDETSLVNGTEETFFKTSNKPLKDTNGNIAGVMITAREITEVVKARQLLQNNERRFAAMAREGFEMTAIVDIEANYLYVSPGCENILGFFPEEYEGKNGFEFIHYRDAGAVQRSFSNLAFKKQVNIAPFRFRHKDGTYRWLESIATDMTGDPAVRGIVFNSRDISEKKKIQDKLKAHEKQLSLIYNSVNDIIFTVTVEDSDKYKLVSVNESLIKASGLVKKDILNRELHEVIPAFSAEFNQIKYRETIEQLATNTWEESIPWPQGVKDCVVTLTPVVNTKGKCNRLICSLRDITQKKLEQQQLKLLESVVMNTNDVIMITSAGPLEEPGPFIMYINDAFIKLTGYQPDDVKGKSPRFLQGEKTDRKELNRISASVHLNQSCRAELVNYKKNGQEYWVDLYIFPLKDDHGNCTHWIAFERDITQRKKQELEKEQLLNELTRSNQELKQFSYITSHNLRGPLTNLMSIAQLIDVEQLKDPVTAVLIEGFKTSTFKLNQTLNDLVKILIIKDAAKTELEEVSFQHTYNVVLVSLSVLIKDSGINIVTDFSEAAAVPFNNVYMESIFLNLITNAIKYRNSGRQPQLKIYSLVKNNKIQLVFEDNGLGLDLAKIKDRIFGLYQRFHSHEDGQGLGLYLVHSQINAAGGNITVESTLNKGSQFIITFK